MINESKNKAMKPETTKAEPQAWQFAGDNGKPPITIKAESQAEAVKKYEDYINH